MNMNTEKYVNNTDYPDKPHKPMPPRRGKGTPDDFRQYADILEVYEKAMVV